MQCVYCSLRLKKYIIFHILYIVFAPLCSAFLKRADFTKLIVWEARRALLASYPCALDCAEFLKRVVKSCPHNMQGVVTRQKQLKHIIN